MAGRTGRARLWIALPGGLAINGVLLVGLILFKPPPPALEEPPIVTLSLERRPVRRGTTPTPTFRRAGETAISSATSSEAALATEGAAPPSRASPSTAEIDPAWAVDGGAYLTPQGAARARRVWNAADQRRYQRACIGLSSEHMTPEEKDRCWDAWGGARPADDKRIGPREAVRRGPEPLALRDPAEKGPFAQQARKQKRCRDYRKRTMPGKGVEPPPLLQGGCF